MWELENDPRPEQYAALAIDHEKLSTKSTFWVGVAKRTHDNAGNAMFPTYEVLLDIDGARIGFGPDSMRRLISKMQEYCDKADALNRELGVSLPTRIEFKPMEAK